VDFGDGTTTTLGAQATATVQHAYQSPATYVVTAVVRDTNGGSSSASTSVVVTPKPTPAVALAASPNPSTLLQQPVGFTATVTQLPTGVTVDHYDWAFGDGATRTTTSNTTSHAYTVPGTYSASVTAVMSDGTRSTSSTDVKVNP
jgi:PKD repeat protein